MFVACNAVLQQPSGVYTLRNYGEKVNCTMSIIFPETFHFLASSVGSQSMPIAGRTVGVETGLVKKVMPVFFSYFLMHDTEWFKFMLP